MELALSKLKTRVSLLEVAIKFGPSLPLFLNHRDPFDRLLIAQALTENLTLVSRDGKFGAYASLKVQGA